MLHTLRSLELTDEISAELTVLVHFDQNLVAEAPTALPPVVSRGGVARPQFSIAAGSGRQKYQVLDLPDL